MSTIQTDFDRIALVSVDGSVQNCHYHKFLLRQLPIDCESVLEIGCGKGDFSRLLAQRATHVLALDLSPEMIRIAREKSPRVNNLEFQIANVMQYDLPPESLDCIVSIATLHHLPLRESLLRMKAALKSGGVLAILDLFQLERNLFTPAGFLDSVLLNSFAVPLSVSLRLLHHGRIRPRRDARDAWAAHEQHDIYPTMNEIRDLCATILPGAKVRKHLLWRYSIVWRR